MARALQTLQIITCLCVAAAAALGYAAASGSVPIAAHIKWGFLVALVPAFTHSMTLFYLIGSSGNVREAIKPFGWKGYLPEMAGFHRVLSPWLTEEQREAIVAYLRTLDGKHPVVPPRSEGR